MAAGGPHELPRHIHVGSTFRERDGEVIDTDLDGSLDVVHVLGGQGGRSEPAALPVNALVVGQLAAMAYGGKDFGTKHTIDIQNYSSVVEKQDGARRNVFGEVFVIQSDPLLIAHRAAGIEDELVPGFEGDFAVLKLSYTDFWTLKVAQNADGLSHPCRGIADHFGSRHMILRGAVRKIHADHIDAGANHRFENFWRVGGRAEGGNDFGMAAHEFVSGLLWI